MEKKRKKNYFLDGSHRFVRFLWFSPDQFPIYILYVYSITNFICEYKLEPKKANLCLYLILVLFSLRIFHRVAVGYRAELKYEKRVSYFRAGTQNLLSF